MLPFPSISQFRSVISQVKHKASYMGQDAEDQPIYNHAAVFPTLNFIGTVKLHGTNAAVVFTSEGVSFQSRERVLTLEADNAGFMTHMSQQFIGLQQLKMTLSEAARVDLSTDPVIAVYGEWCGGNIQRNVAIAGLPKMFVVFAVKINGEWFNEDLPPIQNKEASIYSIYQFPKWIMTIDFNAPEAKQNLLGTLTQAVEDECPVGKHFGQVGVGEGIVWRCVEDPTSDLWFKVKGEKHSASKVKTLAAVDVEAVETVRAFITQTVTEARLQQGLQHLLNEQRKPFDMTSIGDFIRWIHLDVIKEESDTMTSSGIEVKKIGGPLAQAAKRWYVEQMNLQPA